MMNFNAGRNFLSGVFLYIPGRALTRFSSEP